jgi:hypothetical protein
MGADLEDFAASQANDDIGIPNGGNAMGDEQCGPPLGESLQLPQNLLFGLHVDAGKGIIED